MAGSSFLKIRTALLVLITLACLVLAMVAHSFSSNSSQLKEDYIELSSVKYGLFNVDEWKKIVTGIVLKKLEDLEVTDQNESEIRMKLTELIERILNRAEEDYTEANRRSWKVYRNWGNSLFGIFKHLREEIPQMVDEIIRFIKVKENREQLGGFISDRIDQLADSTFSEMDYTLRDVIIERYGYTDHGATLIGLKLQLEHQKKSERGLQFTIMGLTGLVIVLLISRIKMNKWEVLTTVILASIVLTLGLSTPMIDIDARISSLSFMLLGEHVEFSDQVLFYKSKSIIEVVQLMLIQGKPEVVLVGILVLSFSVLFPLSKLVATVFYVFKERWRNTATMRFLVFKTGKWSMADVMVVAIFMAYIGFSGIIGEQLRQLEQVVKNVDILTTNYSTLRPGFFFFTIFATMGILIATKAKRLFQPMESV